MNLPTPIEHYYKNFHPYEKFIIYEGQIDVEYSNRFSEIINDAKIEFTYLPYPRVELSFTSINIHSLVNKFDDEDFILTVKHPLHKINLKFNILSSKHSHNANKFEHQIIALIREFPNYESSLKINKVKLYLVNFLYIKGYSLLSNNNTWYSARCILEEFNTFEITIDALENIKEIKDILRSNKSYAITHVCQLEKKDNSDFSLDEIKNILEKLYYYFSFVNGSWTTPILITGFDHNDILVSEIWWNFFVESHRYINRWFPDSCDQDFQNLFSNFCQKWNEPQWNDVLKKALNWYVETNKYSIMMQGSIVLQQAALEMLANFILVELEQVITKEKYDKKDATKKIRLLLNHYNLPLKIPVNLTNLKKIEDDQDNKFNDSPAIFVFVRKSIVHDTTENLEKMEEIIINSQVKKEDVISEVYILGQWYLEIILLKIFDYQGNYIDRTKQDIWKNLIGENFKLLSQV